MNFRRLDCHISHCEWTSTDILASDLIEARVEVSARHAQSISSDLGNPKSNFRRPEIPKLRLANGKVYFVHDR